MIKIKDFILELQKHDPETNIILQIDDDRFKNIKKTKIIKSRWFFNFFNKNWDIDVRITLLENIFSNNGFNDSYRMANRIIQNGFATYNDVNLEKRMQNSIDSITYNEDLSEKAKNEKIQELKEAYQKEKIFYDFVNSDKFKQEYKDMCKQKKYFVINF